MIIRFPTSQIWTITQRAPERVPVLLQMPREEEITAEEGVILWQVANWNVKIAALFETILLKHHEKKSIIFLENK